MTGTRFHSDACGHGPEAYLGSFEAEGATWDAYAYEDAALGAELCVRYGSEGHEYLSAGPVDSLRDRRDTPGRLELPASYARALELCESRTDATAGTPVAGNRSEGE